jgi:hypothetical protein
VTVVNTYHTYHTSSEHDFALPTDEDFMLRIHTINTSTNGIPIPITIDESSHNGKYTRTKLRKLSTWSLWRAAEKKQLDAMHQQQM